MSNWQPWATGQATPGGLVDYQIPGEQTSVGTSPNVTYTGGNPSLFNTDTSGSAFASGSTTTDTSGTKWVMTPGGQWVKASSDYGQGLTGQGRLFYDQHYDSSGAYVGSEGDQRRSIMANPNTTSWSTADQGAYNYVYTDDLSPVDSSYFGTQWQDTFAADWINENWGINPANPYGHLNERNVRSVLATQEPTQPIYGQ
jgi:hypothetical protein